MLVIYNASGSGNCTFSDDTTLYGDFTISLTEVPDLHEGVIRYTNLETTLKGLERRSCLPKLEIKNFRVTITSLGISDVEKQKRYLDALFQGEGSLVFEHEFAKPLKIETIKCLTTTSLSLVFKLKTEIF